MSSAAWTVAGLILNAIGVVLLFRYGMPYRVRTEGARMIVARGKDEKAIKHETLYHRLGMLGLALVVLGTGMQIMGAWVA